ncbi:putative toxin-antitoxin system toxin component, PIN family [Candidatus Microgenomates bacterium]|nr:putative toxin-antitoxin system toxin component, PIN family [Candidatus Microgenomates bacterium]
MNSSKRPRVIVDTNVFISAIFWGGNPLKVINLWRVEEKYDLIISPEILAEIISKLKYKFFLPQSLLNEWKELLTSRAILIIPKDKVNLCRDSQDNILLESALAGKTDFLITGDKDLLSLKQFKKTQIVSPKQFLKLKIWA